LYSNALTIFGCYFFAGVVEMEATLVYFFQITLKSESLLVL